MSQTLEAELRNVAAGQGFRAVSLIRPRPVIEDREVTLGRVRRGDFAGLPWFDESRVERAADPEQVLPGVRSLVVLAASYAHPTPAFSPGRLRGRVSRYAAGRDYHRVLERRARPLLALLEQRRPGSCSRFLVDHGPLLERAFARRAGIGWQGKNTMILARGAGSWTFLGVLLTTVDLEPDGAPAPQGCGTCTRCLPSCPTGALRAEYEVVNDLCIAYHTIENRGPIPRALRPLMGDWIFGCDLCQEACPVNETDIAPGLPELAVHDAVDAAPDLLEALSLDEASFRARFAGRPILRARYAGFLRNVCIALGNLGDPRAIPALEGALRHREPLVRGHAAWALGRLGCQSVLERQRAFERDSWVRAEIEAALEGGPVS